MTDVFGEALLKAPMHGRPKLEFLPSPEDLKGTFLLKVLFKLLTSNHNDEYSLILLPKGEEPHSLGECIGPR